MLKLKTPHARFTDFDEPMRAKNDTIIHATPEVIFDKLDFASPGNALRERGFDIVPGEIDNRFTITDPRLPHETLQVSVIASVAPKRYAFQACHGPEDAERQFKETTHIFSIEQRVDQACRVSLIEVTTFPTPLSRERYVLERASQGFGVFRTLARLKLHIELGLDAAAID